jgi:uncharacterized membrane protein
MSTTEAVPSRRISISRCFDDALIVYQRNFLALIVAAILVDILSALTLLILEGPLFGGVCLMTLRGLRRDRIGLGELFGAFNRFLPLLGLFFLTAIIVLLGLVFLVVPGLILMTLWLYPFYLVVDRRMGVFESLGESTRLVLDGGFWRHFGLVALGLALAIGPSFIPVVGVVIAFLITPICWLIVASAYVQLTDPDRSPLSDSANKLVEPSTGPDVPADN